MVNHEPITEPEEVMEKFETKAQQHEAFAENYSDIDSEPGSSIGITKPTELSDTVKRLNNDELVVKTEEDEDFIEQILVKETKVKEKLPVHTNMLLKCLIDLPSKLLIAPLLLISYLILVKRALVGWRYIMRIGTQTENRLKIHSSPASSNSDGAGFNQYLWFTLSTGLMISSIFCLTALMGTGHPTLYYVPDISPWSVSPTISRFCDNFVGEVPGHVHTPLAYGEEHGPPGEPPEPGSAISTQ
jgi:hypothetical protein